MHLIYGESVFRWYLSGFEDNTVFTWTNIWLYGGFYDTLTFLLVRISPLPVHDTRHLCNALVGLAGIAGAYKLGGLLRKRWIGFLAALFLVLTPRYYGHAFFNHKDIPFAVLYLWSVYFIIRGLGHLPRLPHRLLWQTGLVLGLTLGIRVGGFVLVAYLALFYGLRYLQILIAQNGRNDPKVYLPPVKSYILQTASIFAVAYATLLLFWPWAQVNPLIRPFQALVHFSKFPYDIRTYFDGEFIRSTEIPWYYAPKWFLLTLPEFLLVALAAGAAFTAARYKRGNYSLLGLPGPAKGPPRLQRPLPHRIRRPDAHAALQRHPAPPLRHRIPGRARRGRPR